MDTESILKDINEQVVRAMNHLHVPGVAIGILHKGQEQTAGFGVTNIENPLPVNTDTLFQAGSIMKTVTGTAAMRLVEMGKLDLDTPINTYLPDLRFASEVVAAQLTIHHLLTHTGGLVGAPFDDVDFGQEALAKMAERIAALPPLTLPGKLFSYSNESFCLIGRVIETITGKTFQEAIRTLVFDPLGMTMSFFFAADVITRRFVVGHHIKDGAPKVARPWQTPRAAHPVGGLISTVKDLLRYARFHVGDGRTADGTRLLAPESLTLIHTPQVSTGHGTNACGIAWWLREVDGTRISWHPGGAKGQAATLYIVPECDFAVIILTNADTGWALIDDVAKQAFHQYFAGLEFEEPPPQSLDRSEDLLATYTGRYVSPMSEVEVSLRGGELMMQLVFYGGFPTKDFPASPPQPPAPLTFYENDHAFVQKGPREGTRCEFLRDSDGHIAWFRIYSRIHVRQQE